jgi:uncharacterized protein (DUF488 family)
MQRSGLSHGRGILTAPAQAGPEADSRLASPAGAAPKRAFGVMSAMSQEPLPFFTIGHSTRPIADFVALLRAGQVAMVVDVRRVPRSRTNPQYNLDRLPDALAPFQIGHERIAELGGLRGRAAEVAPEVNGLWRNRSFHNYADHALGEDFAAGLERLLALGARRRCAIMCAEAVWWRCHRRIIADHLLLRGRPVFHLLGEKRVEPARMTEGAQPAGQRIFYPAAQA